MSNRYSWLAETFPRQMEERGFPRNKKDGLKGFYYRWDRDTWDVCHHLGFRFRYYNTYPEYHHIWKLRSWGFLKCDSFWVWEILNGSYCCSKTHLTTFNFVRLRECFHHISSHICKKIPHRDDGFMLWDALHEYVEGVVRHTYPSDKVNLSELKSKCCFEADIVIYLF